MVAYLRIDGEKQILVFQVVLLEALLRLIAVLRVHRIKPDGFVEHEVRPIDENGRVVPGLFHHPPIKEVFDEP